MAGSLAPVTLSVLNFVDLAGSERQAQAASEDVDQERLRQKEVRREKGKDWEGNREGEGKCKGRCSEGGT